MRGELEVLREVLVDDDEVETARCIDRVSSYVERSGGDLRGVKSALAGEGEEEYAVELGTCADDAAIIVGDRRVSRPVTATVENAVGVLREFEGGVETVGTIYLVDSQGTLAGAVPLAKLVLASSDAPILSMTSEPLISTHETTSDNEVAELFDKYNLVTLPVIDEQNKLVGVITSDDVIAMLRSKL